MTNYFLIRSEVGKVDLAEVIIIAPRHVKRAVKAV